MLAAISFDRVYSTCLGVIQPGKGRAGRLHVTQHPLASVTMGERLSYSSVCTLGGSLKGADCHINFL